MHYGLFEFYRPPETIESLNCHNLEGFTFVNSAKYLTGPVCSCSPLQQWTQMFPGLLQSWAQGGVGGGFGSTVSCPIWDGLTWRRGAQGGGLVFGGQASAEGQTRTQTNPQEDVQSGLYKCPPGGSLQGTKLPCILWAALSRPGSPGRAYAVVHGQPAVLHFPMP